MAGETNNDKNPAETALARLEKRVGELVRTCDRLREENHSLRSQQQALMTERAKLLEKNELARTRVEAMINRLKSMEHNVG